jgi:hypothetical protein
MDGEAIFQLTNILLFITVVPNNDRLIHQMGGIEFGRVRGGFRNKIWSLCFYSSLTKLVGGKINSRNVRLSKPLELKPWALVSTQLRRNYAL